MLNILIVEDESLLATTLKHLVELNPRYQVTAIAADFAEAIAAVEERKPNLALVDLQLANGSTGFSVAAKLNELDIPCLFTSGKAPSFPVPDLAMGCLSKPFNEEDLFRALTAAEDLLRGRETLRPRLPEALEMYSVAEPEPEPAWVPDVDSAPTLRKRIARWWNSRPITRLRRRLLSDPLAIRRVRV